ncbi:MAG TPA: biotin carboxylase N-terminal domain-containing protein, partial [Acidimicrobiia bacterium]
MIRRLLVANRGEIARRVFLTCREMGIETVAVHSDPDSAEPFVLEADIAVALPGSTPAETYLDIAAIISAAELSEVDAIHPGYGFLAENPEFAREVESAGLIWIGPPAGAMEVMGSKLASKELMARIGVPLLPGVDLTGIADAEVADVAVTIGFPVLVKASSGGGGRGMRLVDDPGLLAEAVVAARRE